VDEMTVYIDLASRHLR